MATFSNNSLWALVKMWLSVFRKNHLLTFLKYFWLWKKFGTGCCCRWKLITRFHCKRLCFMKLLFHFQVWTSHWLSTSQKSLFNQRSTEQRNFPERRWVVNWMYSTLFHYFCLKSVSFQVSTLTQCCTYDFQLRLLDQSFLGRKQVSPPC